MRSYLFAIFLISSTPFFSQKLQRPQKTSFRFIENKGQWDNETLFRFQVENTTIFYAKNEIGYYLQKQEMTHHHSSHLHQKPDIVYGHKFITKHLEATTKQVIGQDKIDGIFNYLQGNDQSKWGQDVLSYKGLLYKELYPSIDYVVSQHRHLVKTEYHIAPKGNPSLIRLRYDGVQDIQLENERLLIKTSVTNLIENKPYAFQVIDKDTIYVPCRYVLKGRTVSYQIGNYDDDYELIIDPELIFSTYSGVHNDHWGSTACPDIYGNTIAGGVVFIDDDETQYPVSTGAFQKKYAGGITDVLVMKLDSVGANLIYATYIGGSDLEVPSSFTVDPMTNELIGIVTTGSTDFPITPNCFQKDFAGGRPIGAEANCDLSPLINYIYNFKNGTDFALFKLSEDGSTLNAATYFGGTDNDGLIYTKGALTKNYGDQFRADVFVDEESNIYFSGATKSSDFPTRLNENDRLGGTTDGVLVKLRNDMGRLLFGTYVGGEGEDACFSVKTNDLGEMLVAGGTTSTNLFSNVSGHKKNYNSSIDGFIAKYNKEGKLLTGTYFGTSDYDQIYFIDLDQEANIYAYGQTQGFIASKSFDPNINNPNTGSYSGQFIFKMNSDLTRLIWQTTVGTGNTASLSVNPELSPTAFSINNCNQILYAGWGGDANSEYSQIFCNDEVIAVENGYVGKIGTENLITTTDAYQRSSDGSDFYLGVLSENAEEVVYATFFGDVSGYGDHVDGGTSRFDKKGVVYHNICAGCGLFNQMPKVTVGQPGEFPTSNGAKTKGFCNNGIFKFNFTELMLNLEIIDCQGKEVLVTNRSQGGIKYELNTTDGTVIDSDFKEGKQIVISSEIFKVDTLVLTTSNASSCPNTISERFTMRFFQPMAGIFYIDTTCANDPLSIILPSYDEDSLVSWLPRSPTIDNDSSHKVTFLSDTSADFLVSTVDKYGCNRDDTINIQVFSPEVDVELVIEANCEGIIPVAEITNTSSNYSSMAWKVNQGTLTTVENLEVILFDSYGQKQIDIFANIWQCSDSTQFTYTLYEVEVPNVITPNGDGDNDIFLPIGIENNGNWHLEVFNRWGKRVFDRTEYTNQWGALEQEDGVYYYLLTAPDETFCKGWVQVLR